MKRINMLLGDLAILGLVVGFGSGNLKASARSAQEPSQAQQQQDQVSQTFAGTIVKLDGQFDLEDMAGNMTYHLDDQAKAKKFEGKKVRVTGMLDTQSNTIQISEIQPMKH